MFYIPFMILCGFPILSNFAETLARTFFLFFPMDSTLENILSANREKVDRILCPTHELVNVKRSSMASATDTAKNTIKRNDTSSSPQPDERRPSFMTMMGFRRDSIESRTRYAFMSFRRSSPPQDCSNTDSSSRVTRGFDDSFTTKKSFNTEASKTKKVFSLLP